MLRKAIPFVVACAALLAVNAVPAEASVIDWTLQNVTFDDGGTASGTFSTDSTTGYVTDIDIITTPGTKLAGAAYDDSVEVYNDFWPPNSFLLRNVAAFFDLELAFVDPLTTAGTDLLALQRASYECRNCSPSRIIVSGEAVSAVPEPATLAILSTGLLFLGTAFRRKA
jgi:hypothetical protein